MSTRVIMPALSLTMEEGTVSRWLKAEGEPVSKGETIAVIETDKASMDLEAPANGILQQIVAPAGTVVPVTQVVAYIADASEAVLGAVMVPQPVEAPSGTLRISPRARRAAVQMGIDVTRVQGTGPGGRVIEDDVLRFAMEQQAGKTAFPDTPALLQTIPPAKKLAEEKGVALEGVSGMGPSGRITVEDIMSSTLPLEPQRVVSVADTPGVAEPAATRLGDADPGDLEPGLTGRIVPLSRKRRLTAERMELSARSIPRITITMEANVAETVRLRQELLPIYESDHGIRLSYNDILVRIVARALAEHGYLNARWASRGVWLVDQINVGVAMAVPDGLVVPVIKEADQKNLLEIAKVSTELVSKAREDRLTLEDISGGTFTITNLGMYGVETFTPIVNSPEAAILGVGQILEKPMVRDGKVVVLPMMALSLSVDHRVADGAPAAQFLARVRQLLETPSLLV